MDTIVSLVSNESEQAIALREVQEQLREIKLSLEWKDILLKSQEVAMTALKGEVERASQRHRDEVNWIHEERVRICDALKEHDLLLLPHDKQNYRIVNRGRIDHHYQLSLF